MNRMFLLWSLWTVLAGVGIPLIGVLSNGVARSVGNPVSATAVMFAIAFAVVAVLALVFYGVPRAEQLTAVPLVNYGAGLLMVFYALSATIIIPRFGAGNFVAFILLAQLLMAALIDQFGLFGIDQRPLNLMRLVAFALIAIGIVVMQMATTKNPS